MRVSKLSEPSAAPADGPVLFNLPSRHAGGRMKELFKIAVVVFEAIAVVVLIVGTVLYIGRFVIQMSKARIGTKIIGISERALAVAC